MMIEYLMQKCHFVKYKKNVLWQLSVRFAGFNQACQASVIRYVSYY